MSTKVLTTEELHKKVLNWRRNGATYDLETTRQCNWQHWRSPPAYATVSKRRHCVQTRQPCHKEDWWYVL